MSRPTGPLIQQGLVRSGNGKAKIGVSSNIQQNKERFLFFRIILSFLLYFFFLFVAVTEIHTIAQRSKLNIECKRMLQAC